jgi:CTP-dependent riboflavin kinase
MAGGLRDSGEGLDRDWDHCGRGRAPLALAAKKIRFTSETLNRTATKNYKANDYWGRVIPGLGKGQFFLSLEPYYKALQRLIGAPVYPGTLNLKLGRAEWAYLYQNANYPIEPFVLEERRFSAVRALRVEIEGDIPGAIVFPEKGLHPGVVEIASDRYLRDTLNLRDGDTVAFSCHCGREPPNIVADWVKRKKCISIPLSLEVRQRASDYLRRPWRRKGQENLSYGLPAFSGPHADCPWVQVLRTLTSQQGTS